MASYTKIETPDGPIWAEVDESARSDGYMPVGSTQNFLETLGTLRKNAQTIIKDLRQNLVDRPDEIEVEFGIKIGGEIGNTFFALAKASTEASYAVKITWKQGDVKGSES